tara:strand:- start:199 stop:381 length:183 start_codon:yes stop_codon:yes gene_type:complete
MTWIIVVCLIIVAFAQISFLYSEFYEPSSDAMHNEKMSVLRSINSKLESIENHLDKINDK